MLFSVWLQSLFRIVHFYQFLWNFYLNCNDVYFIMCWGHSFFNHHFDHHCHQVFTDYSPIKCMEFQFAVKYQDMATIFNQINNDVFNRSWHSERRGFYSVLEISDDGLSAAKVKTHCRTFSTPSAHLPWFFLLRLISNWMPLYNSRDINPYAIIITIPGTRKRTSNRKIYLKWKIM